MASPSIQLLLLTFLFGTSYSIECYSGLKVIAGQSVGTQTVQCDSSGAQCYNMTASAAVLVDVVKAGCSLWRCMLARDTCIRTTFQNIPISLCCCSSNRCNVAENGIGGGFSQQSIGGWNAEPPHEMRTMNKEDALNRFKAMDLDEDTLHTTTRATRLGDEVHIP